jgi:hypothetical protein
MDARQAIVGIRKFVALWTTESPRIGEVDGQPQFGGGAGQILVETRERGDTAIEGLGSLG